MRNKKTQEIVLLAILTALTTVLGLFVKLPTPNGVTTLLDVGIFFTAFYLGGKQGAIVGGLASFLFDLLAGYPQWMFISLLAHGAQGYFAGFRGKGRYLGLGLAILSMVGVYFLASGLMYGFGAALADIVTNTMQNIVGILGGAILYRLFKTYLDKVLDR